MKNACRSEILIPGEIYTAAQEFALIGFKVGKARPRLANSASEGPADFPAEGEDAEERVFPRRGAKNMHLAK